ncbi:AHH domain-containing protein [Myxococcus fulvus]|uniref:AHH domain-containing protein n=1 Tax=Myxococcus fulvus TaxID=33 RepID=UPI000943BC8F
MRGSGIILLCLLTGCATPRVVNLDAGQGRRIAYTSMEVAPVEVEEDDFQRALSELVLGLKLDVAFREADALDQRGWGRSRALLASSRGRVDSSAEPSPEALYARLCPVQDACLTLMGGAGLAFSRKDRTLMALSLALDEVWESVEDGLGPTVNPGAFKAVVSSAALALLLTMSLPEPITQTLAIALTASLVAYLGVAPVWEMKQGFIQLWDESARARSLVELRDIGQRFGRVLGVNGARVLVLVLTAGLTGREVLAARGPRLPGFSGAALRAQAEGGFKLEAALGAGVSSIALPEEGRLDVALAPKSVAVVASYSTGRIPGDAEGHVNHLCTTEGTPVSKSGETWAELCEEIFERAGMSLEDVANKVRLAGRGASPSEPYHSRVVPRLQRAVEDCEETEACRVRLVNELARIANELLTPGSELRGYVVKTGR